MKTSPILKLLLELGPLVVFFAGNSLKGIYFGTAAFMAATVIALIISYALTRTVPIMPLVTGVFVLVFGGLTLYLADELFIKLKPTIVNVTFAAILFVGLHTGRLFIKLVLEAAVQMTERGWIILTRAWICYFLFLAALNEVVWRSTTTDTWLTFKVFGMMPLTLLFSIATVPIMMRHTLSSDNQNEPDPR